jgi:hypothetical protein
MLDQSADVVAPHPPHIMERLGGLVDNYGDLASDENFAAMVNDVCLIVESNPVAWGLGEIDRSQVLGKCSARSLVAVYGAVHDMLSVHEGARDWFCKSLANVHFINSIESYFGNSARYIHLHRDPRDVALSFQKAIVGEKTWYHIAKQWHDEQQKAIQLSKTVPHDRFLSVSYQQLTVSPKQTLEAVCKFMDISFSDDMLNFHQSNEAQSTAQAGEMWENVGRPIMASNSNKFLTSAPLEGLAIMERVAGESMDYLGYKKASADWIVGAVDDAMVEGFTVVNRALKATAIAKAATGDVERRKPQDDVLKSIKTRLIGSILDAS